MYGTAKFKLHPKDADAVTDNITGPISRDRLRHALSQFPTGVTVITCALDSGPLGMTANSFNSVSLDPPLVLWSIMKTASRYAHFAAAQRFSIHVLHHDQADLCSGFAKNGQYFDYVEWHHNDSGVPVLDRCLVRFDCEQYALHDAGDHSIIVGRVTQFAQGLGRPLIFSQGTFL